MFLSYRSEEFNMNSTFLKIAASRRSIYALGKKPAISKGEISGLVKNAVMYSPTAFHNQSVRVVILYNEKHDQVWDIVSSVLKPVARDEESWAKTAAKVAGFKAAYGTVLFFTDDGVVKDYEKKFPPFAANFRDWSEQAMGIANYSVWVALAEAGIGASLQHYNPLIDEKVRGAFDIPPQWILRGQMPFGSIEAPAGDKVFIPEDQWFRVLGE
jgi:predicted oxidoreductase (fatty acid repression mutant protein)